MDTLDEFVIDTRPPIILLPDFCLKSSFESRTEIKKKRYVSTRVIYHRVAYVDIFINRYM